MNRDRAGLSVVGETALSPLYAKAMAAELMPESGLSDPLAVQLLTRIGYDPDRVLTDRTNVAGTVYRTLAIDEAVLGFAGRHPEGQLVSAGIGLCTRHARLADRIPTSFGWVGVDTVDVVSARRTCLPDDPVRLLIASVTEPGWAADADAGRPTMVVAEGVLMYLRPEGLTTFLSQVRDHFGAGTELLADYFHPRIALSGRHPIVRKTGAQFRSGARNGTALAGLVPGFELLGEYPVMERISAGSRLAATTFTKLTRGGRMYSIAHLKVTDAAKR